MRLKQSLGSKVEVRQAYIPALRQPLLKPLSQHGAAGVEEVIALMDTYSLSKDDFDAIMEMQLLAPGASADIATIPSNVKSALTRKYNQAHQAFHKAPRNTSRQAPTYRLSEDGIAESPKRPLRRRKPRARSRGGRARQKPEGALLLLALQICERRQMRAAADRLRRALACLRASRGDHLSITGSRLCAQVS